MTIDTVFWILLRTPTSHLKPAKLRRRYSNSVRTRFSSAPFLAHIAPLAPRRANSGASASPRPRDLPVLITTRPRNSRYRKFRTQRRPVRALREQLPDLSAIGSLEALFSHSIQIVPSKTLDNTRGRPNNK